MFIEASKSQPEATRPTKPRKSRLSLVKKEQEKGIIVFILKLFKYSIKNNIFRKKHNKLADCIIGLNW
jgi:hypothetical protein